jgi:lipopolysaccharide transport system permease protein
MPRIRSAWLSEAAERTARVQRRIGVDCQMPGARQPLNAVAAPQGAGALSAAPAITLIEPRAGWRGVECGELWHYRELLYFLVWRDIKVRYKQTVVGAAWAVLQPVCTMVIFSVFFGGFARIPSDGVAYPVFVYAGLLPWLFFANAVSQASGSMVSQTHLLTKVYFPRLFLPAASIGVGLIDFALSFAVYAGLMFWYAHVPGPAILLIPFLVCLTATTAFGTGVLLAGLTVAYRDFRIVVPFLVQVWFFLSPVVYPLTIVPQSWRWIMTLNPMTGIIGAFRAALLGQPADWPALATAVVVSCGAVVLGVLHFRRTERLFADIV